MILQFIGLPKNDSDYEFIAWGFNNLFKTSQVRSRSEIRKITEVMVRAVHDQRIDVNLAQYL
jgi:hypothetical protein